MAFVPVRTKPIVITVDAQANGQQIVNSFTYVNLAPAAPATNLLSSTTLTAFRTFWRDQVLPNMYPAYRVERYWLRQITDVVPIQVGDPPWSYKNVWHFHQDFLDYAGGLDHGTKALVGEYLPTFVAANIRWNLEQAGRAYWRSSTRLGPFAEADQGTTANYWNGAFLATMGEIATEMPEAFFADGSGGGNLWGMCVFSPNHYGRVNKPLGLGMYMSCNRIMSGTPRTLVSTQMSRKQLKPAL